MTTWTRDHYSLTDDPASIDMDVVHGFLHDAYWSPGIPRALLGRALRNSMPFALLHDGKQVGMARVISDRATFAYVADVFVLPDHRGQGLATWMMEKIAEHADLKAIKRWVLATRDAHGVYRRVGYHPLGDPTRWMERAAPPEYTDDLNGGCPEEA